MKTFIERRNGKVRVIQMKGKKIIDIYEIENEDKKHLVISMYLKYLFCFDNREFDRLALGLK